MLRRSLYLLCLLPVMAAAPLAHASEEEEEPEETVTGEVGNSELYDAHLVATYHWKNHVKGVAGKGASLNPDDNGFVSIERTTQTGGTTRLLVIEKPKLNSSYYALRGEIRYQSVSGIGYLELLNHFPNQEGEFFTRTLAEYGPMRRISGHSRLRTFWLPFNAEEAKSLPDKLTLNLVMASVGKVEIGPLDLFEFADAQSMMMVATAGNEAGTPLSLSSPERRLKMAFTLLGITVVVGGIHFWHLKRERNRREA